MRDYDGKISIETLYEPKIGTPLLRSLEAIISR